MAARLYVGNLSYNTGDAELRDAFASSGNVVSATVVIDRESGRSRGFGFVEFASSSEAQSAISEMNGASLDGRALTVNEARERTQGGGGGNRGSRPPRW
jgi:RNA recognition motif-containing protein